MRSKHLKILFEAPIHVPHIGVETFCTNALRHLGFEVIRFEYWKPLRFKSSQSLDTAVAMQPSSKIKIRRKSLPSLMLLKTIYNSYRTIKKIKAVKPDVLFVLGGKSVPPALIRTIKDRFNLMTICWAIDDPQLFHLSRKFASAYNMFFTDDPYSVGLYRKIGVNSYPITFGCDPVFHKKIVLTSAEKRKYGSNIVFNGTLYPDRIRILEAIADLGLSIWGLEQECFKSSSILRSCYRGDCTISELVKIYNASKILLNPHLGFGEPLEKRGTWANLRLFEGAGSGIFQLVDRKPLIEKCFSEGKEIVFFKDTDELRRLVKKYLFDDEDREKIANAAYRRAHSDHTFSHRMEQIFSLAGYIN